MSLLRQRAGCIQCYVHTFYFSKATLTVNAIQRDNVKPRWRLGRRARARVSSIVSGPSEWIRGKECLEAKKQDLERQQEVWMTRVERCHSITLGPTWMAGRREPGTCVLIALPEIVRHCESKSVCLG
jgi:hypothetical protein